MALTMEVLGPYRQLKAAVGRRDLKAIRALLDAGVSPNPVPGAEGDDSVPALSHVVAVDDHDDQMLKLLLDAGADPNLHGDSGYDRPPLHTAVARAPVSTVQLLLDAGADATLQDEHRRSPWHCAEFRPEVREMIEDRGGLPDGITLLMDRLQHAIKERGDSARPLSDADQYLPLNDHPDAAGVLATGVIYRNFGYVRSLIKRGFPIRRPGQPTPLMTLAARHGAVEVIRDLLKHGVPPDESDTSQSPLEAAISNRVLTSDHQAAIDLLIEAGHPLEASTDSSQWLRGAARRAGHHDLARRLPEHPNEVPVDPAMQEIQWIRMHGPRDSYGDPTFALYQPNNPARPLAIVSDHGRDEWYDTGYAAPGINPGRDRPWPAGGNELAEQGYGWLGPLIDSWREGKPLSLKAIFDLCQRNSVRYDVKYFERN